MRRAWTSNPDYPPCRYRAVDVKSRAVKRIVDWIWDALVLIKYPKLVMLALVTVVAFALFRDDGVQSFFHELGDMEYLSAFFGGMLFAFGFGAPFGVAILLTISGDVNLLAAGVIAGTGALVSDLLLFKFVRMTFQDEIDRLWEKLTDGGEPQPCGWLKDRYGVSWQVVPVVLAEMLNDPDPKKAGRVMKAMLAMGKIEIKPLEKAFHRKLRLVAKGPLFPHAEIAVDLDKMKDYEDLEKDGEWIL